MGSSSIEKIRDLIKFSYEYKENIEKLEKGQSIKLDGIECVGIPSIYGDIAIDKNHDLSYYVFGNDFYNEDIRYIGNKNKGFIYSEDFIATDSIYKGLQNSNRLIDLYGNKKSTIWYRLKIFRGEIGSDKWFIPSREEIQMMVDLRFQLKNFTFLNTSIYSTSTELSTSTYSSLSISNGQFFPYEFSKNNPFNRVRLFRAL